MGVSGADSRLESTFTPIESDVLYLRGSTARAPVTQTAMLGSLVVPATSQSAPIDYAHVYMVLDDYADLTGTGLDAEGFAQATIERLLNDVPRQDLLAGLGLLTAVLKRPSEQSRVLDDYRSLLDERARACFDNRCRPGQGQRWPLSRQSLLGAYRCVLAMPDVEPLSLLVSPMAQAMRQAPALAAIALTHAIGATYGHEYEDEDEDGEIAGLPARVAIDFVINQGFNSGDDDLAVLDRTLRLWRDYDEVGASRLKGVRPSDLLHDACGLEVEDFLAMGFAVWSHTVAWALGGPQLLDPGLHPGIDSEKWGRFMALVAATPEEFGSSLGKARSQWDFVGFQAHPVLRLEGGLMLIDQEFLIDRVTTGLYWLVHDYMKARSERDRKHWTQAWGAMVEALCEDELRPLAPPVLGGGSTFYTEEDIATAYGNDGPRADVTIDFGEAFGVFEIVSGQLTTATRVDGNPVAFAADMNKLVYKKAAQLSGTSAKLLSDVSKLTAAIEQPKSVYPVVITAGGLPVNPITVQLTREHCAQADLFDHALNHPVALIDLGELEMLEALGERGKNPVELIARWQSSSLAGMPLQNWLLAEFGREIDQYRPRRVKPRTDALFDDMIRRLGFTEEAAWTDRLLRSESTDSDSSPTA